MLAYCGLARGHTYVHEAIGDPELHDLALRLMGREAAPTIAAAPNQNLAAYAEALIARFANPSLNHRLIQIAMDGSQKIPQRWLETLAANAKAGKSCPAILTAIAAWIRHLQGHNGTVDDPMAARLSALARKADTADTARAIFAHRGPLAGIWEPDNAEVEAMSAAYAQKWAPEAQEGLCT
ncbi:hypothetical protein [Novosphingobium sp. SL115]|uniref:mannitol dehydrogenase family protein n=1 Tax=Novosphingobium sp. SL115 TaxID=2995150 RepID=UPI003FA35E0C